MSAFSTLLALINAQIKTNGLKAITGAKLNGVLVQMVNELGSGYQFIDIATPATDPGTPDENVWYIASQAGTYTNFGDIIVNENEVCALVWNGSWTKKVTGAATAAQVNQLGQYVKPVDKIMADFSVIMWTVGNINSDGTINPNYYNHSRLFSSIIKAPAFLTVKSSYSIPFVVRYTDDFEFIERVSVDRGSINVESGYIRIVVETAAATPISVDDDFVQTITIHSVVGDIQNIYNILGGGRFVQNEKLFELNLFNRNDTDYTDNGYVNYVTGVIGSNVNYESSGYINIESNTDYTISPIRHYAFYDKNKAFISGDEEDGGETKVIHSPSNAAYMRVDRDKRIIYSHDIFVHSGNNIHALYRPYGIVELEDKVDDIAVPSKEYMLKSTQNDIFVEPIIKRVRPYDYDVRFSGSVGFTRRLSRVASVVPSDDASMTIKLVDRRCFRTNKTINTQIIVGDAIVDTGAVKVSIIGDSFTQGSEFNGFFKTALLDNGFTPNIQLIGTRRIKDYPTQHMEGRGGWKMSTYFTYIPDSIYFFNPFMQPDGQPKYWGSVEFWKKCWEVHNGTDTSWNSVYRCGAYDDCINKFNESTGYLLNPSEGDMMYDFSLSKLRVYTGGNWYNVSFDDYNWNFNYSKYLSMWNLSTPDILCEMLGLNDFYMSLGNDCENIDFTDFFTNLDSMINSFQSANQNGKFAILLPCSSCGSLDNVDGEYTDMTDAAMWNLRKVIIDRYDNKEAQGIYLVDIGITVDKENGFALQPTTSQITKPYAEYAGDKRLEIQVNVPHPTPNYPSMGRPLAAFIQAIRN